MEMSFDTAMKELANPIFISGIALGFLVLVVLALMYLLKKPTDVTAELPTPNDMLTEFRRLREQGLMSEAEYERVRRKLGNQIRAAAGQAPMEIEKLPPLPADESEGEFEWEDVDLKSLDEPPSNPKAT